MFFNVKTGNFSESLANALKDYLKHYELRDILCNVAFFSPLIKTLKTKKPPY